MKYFRQFNKKSPKFRKFRSVNYCTGPGRNGRISVKFRKFRPKSKTLSGGLHGEVVDIVFVGDSHLRVNVIEVNRCEAALIPRLVVEHDVLLAHGVAGEDLQLGEVQDDDVPR